MARNTIMRYLVIAIHQADKLGSSLSRGEMEVIRDSTLIESRLNKRDEDIYKVVREITTQIINRRGKNAK